MVDTYKRTYMIRGYTGVWKLARNFTISYAGSNAVKYGIFVRQDGVTIFTDMRNAL